MGRRQARWIWVCPGGDRACLGTEPVTCPGPGLLPGGLYQAFWSPAGLGHSGLQTRSHMDSLWLLPLQLGGVGRCGGPGLAADPLGPPPAYPEAPAPGASQILVTSTSENLNLFLL